MLLGKWYIVDAMIDKWSFFHVDCNYHQRSICERRKTQSLGHLRQHLFGQQKACTATCAKITHFLALWITKAANIYEQTIHELHGE